jgi:uncharacterized protein
MLYGYFVEPYRVETTFHLIETDKLSRARFRIVQISDTHCDRSVRNELRLPVVINSLSPDVVVFTGDAVNVPGALPNFQKMMCAMEDRLGKYAVKGNFEVGVFPELDCFADTGFQVLDRRIVSLCKESEEILLVGLNVRPWDESVLSLSNLPRIPTGRFVTFLYHTPDLVESFLGFRPDLYLAGHTHGGQVALPFYGALITLSRFGKKYEAGKYDVEKTTLYVNRGVGMEGGSAPRFRFFSRPEIAVFDIVPRAR